MLCHTFWLKLQNFAAYRASNQVIIAGWRALPPQRGVCEHFLSANRTGTGGERGQATEEHDEGAGDAINNSLSDSEQIAEAISRIKAGGYDVFVVLEATIGFNQHEQAEDEEQEEVMQLSSAELKMTPQDLKFLKSLRIRVEEG